MYKRAVQEVIAHLEQRVRVDHDHGRPTGKLNVAITSLRDGGDPTSAKTYIQEEMDRLQMRESYTDTEYTKVKQLRALESFLDEIIAERNQPRFKKTPNTLTA